MHMCTHTRTNVCTDTHTHTHTHTSTHLYTHAHTPHTHANRFGGSNRRLEYRSHLHQPAASGGCVYMYGRVCMLLLAKATGSHAHTRIFMSLCVSVCVCVRDSFQSAVVLDPVLNPPAEQCRGFDWSHGPRQSCFFTSQDAPDCAPSACVLVHPLSRGLSSRCHGRAAAQSATTWRRDQARLDEQAWRACVSAHHTPHSAPIAPKAPASARCIQRQVWRDPGS